MMRNELIEKMKQILKDEIDVGEVRAEDSFLDDLEMSSVEIFSFIASLESALRIRIPERVISQVSTVGELADAIEKLQ